MARSPACFGDAGDHAIEGQLAEAKPAQLKTAKKGAGAPASLATIVTTRLELRRKLLLVHQTQFCHKRSVNFPFGSKWHAEQFQQFLGLFGSAGRGHKRDIHPQTTFDLVQLDFRKDRLIVHSISIGPASIE